MSWFVAWLVLDEKRTLARRHGLRGGLLGAVRTVLRIYSGLLGSRLYQVKACMCRRYSD